METLQTTTGSNPVKIADIQFNSVLVFEVLRTNGQKENLYVGFQRSLTMSYFDSVEVLKNNTEYILATDPTVVAYRTVFCCIENGVLRPHIKWELKVKNQLQ